MTAFTEILTNVHFYLDLIALVAAILALLPIYRDFGRKFFAVALVVLFLCVVGLSISINSLHRNELAKVQSHIIQSLRNGPETFDELGHSLGFNEVGQMSEALDAMLNAPDPEVQHEDVTLKNCDGSIVISVRRYYLKPPDNNRH
jgi:hypothetical protein